MDRVRVKELCCSCIVTVNRQSSSCVMQITVVFCYNCGQERHDVLVMVRVKELYYRCVCMQELVMVRVKELHYRCVCMQELSN
jgi:hypothetical protein